MRRKSTRRGFLGSLLTASECVGVLLLSSSFFFNRGGGHAHRETTGFLGGDDGGMVRVSGITGGMSEFASSSSQSF